MNSKEARDRLISLKMSYKIRIEEEDIEALDMGAEALENQKTGHWVVYSELNGEWEGTKKYACDKCGVKVGVFKSNFCPNCGAKMEGESDKIEKICCNCIHDKESEPTIDNCATCHEQNNFTPKPEGE